MEGEDNDIDESGKHQSSHEHADEWDLTNEHIEYTADAVREHIGWNSPEVCADLK
jgi:hypothetical protein